jgi:hypothetical protein
MYMGALVLHLIGRHRALSDLGRETNLKVLKGRARVLKARFRVYVRVYVYNQNMIHNYSNNTDGYQTK